MDDYKFRGFDAIGKRGWVYGDLVHNQRVTATGLVPRVMVGGYEVLSATVGLFTGLKDKNGHEIWEGDIIRSDYYNVAFSVTYRCGQWVAVAADGSWTPLLEDNETISDCLRFIEVVGNIHDNPELLKE